MFYVKYIQTPANTPRLSPKTTRIKMWGGVIHRVEIMFPPGPQGLLHVQLFHGGHQIFPSTHGQSFAGDDETISFNDFYKLEPGFNTLIIKTWNEDDTYDHVCRVRIGVLPEWVVTPHILFTGITSSLKTLLRRIGVID